MFNFDKKTEYEDFLELLKKSDSLNSLNLSGMEFEGLDFSKKSFTGCSFSNSKFKTD